MEALDTLHPAAPVTAPDTTAGRRLRSVLAACAAYLALALGFSWPLPLGLSTRLLGNPGGDAGVYVWNLWVFRHELVDYGRSPFFTSTLFAPAEHTGLALHNYTVFADLLALPWLNVLGLIATFNAVYLVIAALNGLGLFLLARHLTRDTPAAFLAGASFAFSPFLMTRATEHFSLLTAAALPVFLLLLLRARETLQRRHAIGAGAALAGAFFSDAYYGVFCLLMAGYALAGWLLEAYSRPEPASAREGRSRRALGTLLLVVAGVTVWQMSSRRTLYTPVLLLTLLALGYWASAARLGLRLRAPTPSWRVGLRLVAWGLATAASALLPLLHAFASSWAEGRYVQPEVNWRSSPPGIDVLALLIPNPNHPLFGWIGRDWLALRPNGYVENVASQSLVVLAVLAAAALRRPGSLPRFWVGFTGLFALLAAGPFVRVAALDTHVPTPWTLLRYVPVLANARSPTRFAVLVTLGSAILFAHALKALRRDALRGGALAGVAGLLLFELLPAPRTLFDARIPRVYQRIASDPSDVTVLELPVGVRSGASNEGNFSAFSQFCQTAHGKSLFGGYLSRVEPQRVEAYRRFPLLDALFTLSSGGELTEEQGERARLDRRRFREEARLGYVVIDTERASARLQRFAINVLRLRKVGAEGRYDLYVPYSFEGVAHP